MKRYLALLAVLLSSVGLGSAKYFDFYPNPSLPSQFAKFYVNSRLLISKGHYGFYGFLKFDSFAFKWIVV
jgi:hypothetical protein